MVRRPVLGASPLPPLAGFAISVGSVAGLALSLLSGIDGDSLVATGLLFLVACGVAALVMDARGQQALDDVG